MDRQAELALWTRRFATMVHSGVSLVYCLRLLEEEPASGALREPTRALREKITAGKTLSETLREWPDLFGEEYVDSVRVGEIGGVLDRTMERLSARIEAGRAAPNYVAGAAVTRGELAEWFWRLAAMLEAGVPLLPALQTLSELGHPVLREIAGQMHREVSAGFSIAPMSRREEAPDTPQPAMWRYPGMFGPVVRQLVGMSVWFGPLVERLKRVAEVLDHEAGLEAAGQLPPLSAEPAEAPVLVAAEGTHPVVHRVNGVLKALVSSGARSAELGPTEEGVGVATLTKASGEVVLTERLEQYPQMVRRVRLLAGMDPLARDEGAYQRGQIHVRVGDQEYQIAVRAGGDRLVLHLGKETGMVEL